MIERLSGTDALLWHMERPGSPMHTLKTTIVDPTRRGAPLTLGDIEMGIAEQLGLVPRLAQRVVAARWFPGRPFWVTDPRFVVADHLDEVVAEPPGDRIALDLVHTRLASENLDVDRPLWSITLVHGLEGGRQALVVRIHHAVLDGGAALNGLLALTGQEPGARPDLVEPPEAVMVTDAVLRRRVLRGAPAHVARLAPLLREAVRGARRTRDYRRAHPDLPSSIAAPRNFVSSRIDDSRVCASTDLDLDRIRRIAKAADVTINGVYHALIASALREELAQRGEALGPSMASFGISADDGDPSRVSGNQVTPTTVRVFTEESDPVRRLVETARSCREGVELRRAAGLDLTGRWASYTCRLTAGFLRHGGRFLPRVNSHVVTANVRGPDHRRWAGPLEITDWISFAVVANPSNINVTAHSYAGQMSVGLLVGHGVLPEPRRFLDRMAAELDVLENALRPDTGSSPRPPTSVPSPREPARASRRGVSRRAGGGGRPS